VIRNDELGRMLNKVVKDYLKVLPHHVSGGKNINFSKQVNSVVNRLVSGISPCKILAKLLSTLKESFMVFLSLTRQSPG
jgi:hypothetical protein